MDRYDAQVAESIKSLFELTSRIDERVKFLSENTLRTEARFDGIIEGQQNLLERIVALENKQGEVTKKELEDLRKFAEDLNNRTRIIEIQMKAVEIISKGNSNKWDKITDIIWKTVIIIATSFLIWKLGIGS